MSKAVRFGDLRHFLEDLGFQTTRGARHVLFQHAPSDTLIVLKPYRSTQAVRPSDLDVVRTMLDQRGLVEAVAFEQALLTGSS